MKISNSYLPGQKQKKTAGTCPGLSLHFNYCLINADLLLRLQLGFFTLGNGKR